MTKELVGKKKAVWDNLTGNLCWDVWLRHNYYNGRNYEMGYQPVYIMAKDAEDARTVVLDHLHTLERHIRSKRARNGRLMVRHCDRHVISPKSIGKISPSVLISGKAFNRFGERVTYNRPSWADMP